MNKNRLLRGSTVVQEYTHGVSPPSTSARFSQTVGPLRRGSRRFMLFSFGGAARIVDGDMNEERQLSPEIYQLLASGRKIAAIKMIREETGMGLAEAKQLADLLSGQDSTSDSMPPAMTEEGGASGILAIVVALLIAFLVYGFFLGD